LADRIHDANAEILITADGTFRRGKVIDLKSVADEAVGASPSIKTTVVVRHAGNPVISEPIGGRFCTMSLSKERAPNALRNLWTQKMRSLYSTRPGARGCQKASFTRPQAIWLRRLPRYKPYLTYTTTTCGGALLTSDG